MREFFFGVVAVAVAAVVVVFLRAQQQTIDTALILTAAALAFLLACVGLAVLVYAIADVRRAQHPPVSHDISIDRRQYAVDARRQAAAVLPPETMEVTR